MQTSNKQWIGGVVGLVIIVLIAGFFWHKKAEAPVVTSSGITETASSTGAMSTATSTSQTVVATTPFPINSLDTIASWNFKGSYSGNATLTAQANADVTHLTGLLGKGQYNDYDLYDGIANDYTDLGDGATAYHDYNLAIHLYPATALAYTNLAILMTKLGAYNTAADAYAKAVAVEPSVLEYHLERLTYLTTQFPNNTTMVTAAFADASKQFGDTPSVLSVEAEWLTAVGRYADAIKAWQTVETLSPGQDNSSIDAAIAKLKAKE